LALLALFEAITVAVHFEDVDVVGQPIEQRTGQSLGADDLMMPPSSKELCVELVFSTQRSACSKGIGEKAGFWKIETRVTEAHFGKVRSGRRRDCISTSCAT
jgi:hypothetical protein